MVLSPQRAAAISARFAEVTTETRKTTETPGGRMVQTATRSEGSRITTMSTRRVRAPEAARIC